MLSGELPPDTGTIALEKNAKIGYLKQDIDFVAGRTVLEEAYQAFTTLMRLEEELDHIHHEMAERTDYESDSYNDLLIRLHDVTHEYEIHGGYTYKGDTERILSGLGFSREDFSRLTDSFSGGWRMRIELAKLLLEKNDILLLDEPTNHLDIESIIWFEGFLKSFPGAVVIISHDKMFLDNVTNRTIEIVAGRIYDYPKPYSAFLELRKEMITQQLAAQKNQEKMIQQTEKLIDKFRAKASKASMAQSLIKKLDRIERIEVDEQETAVMSVRFPLSQQPGKVVLEIDHVSKSYDKKLDSQGYKSACGARFQNSLCRAEWTGKNYPCQNDYRRNTLRRKHSLRTQCGNRLFCSESSSLLGWRAHPTGHNAQCCQRLQPYQST